MKPKYFCKTGNEENFETVAKKAIELGYTFTVTLDKVMLEGNGEDYNYIFIDTRDGDLHYGSNHPSHYENNMDIARYVEFSAVDVWIEVPKYE